jgi:TPP-dependent pyruvate/acetoin dehydrogenase alpha subunit
VRATELERRRKEDLLAAHLAEAEGRGPSPTAEKEKPEEAMEVDTAPSAERLRAKLLATGGATPDELQAARDRVEATVRAAVAYADASPLPDPAQLYDCMFKDQRP